ncbi:collagen alpha-1(I) chain-like [Mustela erminea]|uniref:collagen alpha-1(I) chain-like n=1 Tax=Mustela erminea TaxID=36723 RepID=UPI001386F47F|nr:collagen alpha-1(I) chain-like [Mustela erminea]
MAPTSPSLEKHGIQRAAPPTTRGYRSEGLCGGPGSARGPRGEAATSAARARSVPPGARGSDGADHGGSRPRTQRLGPPSWVAGTLDPGESEGDRDRTVAPGRPGRPAGTPARAGGPPTSRGPGAGTRQRSGEGAAAEWGGGRRRAPRGARPGPQGGRCRHGPHRQPSRRRRPPPRSPPPRTYAAGGPGPEREPTAWRAAGRSSLCDRSPYSERALPTRGRAGTLLRMLGAVRAGNPSDSRGSAGAGAGGGRPRAPPAPAPRRPTPAGTSVENCPRLDEGRFCTPERGSPLQEASRAPRNQGAENILRPKFHFDDVTRYSYSFGTGCPRAQADREGLTHPPERVSPVQSTALAEPLRLEPAKNGLGPRWAAAASRKAEVAGADAGQSRGPAPGPPRSCFQASQAPRGPGSIRDRRGSRRGPCGGRPRPPGQELSGEVPAGGGAAGWPSPPGARGQGRGGEVAPEAGRQRGGQPGPGPPRRAPARTRAPPGSRADRPALRVSDGTGRRARRGGQRLPAGLPTDPSTPPFAHRAPRHAPSAPVRAPTGCAEIPEQWIPRARAGGSAHAPDPAAAGRSTAAVRGTAVTASGGRREPGPPAPPQLLPQDHSRVGCSRPPATTPLPEESGSRSEAPAGWRARDERPEVTSAREPRGSGPVALETEPRLPSRARRPLPGPRAGRRAAGGRGPEAFRGGARFCRPEYAGPCARGEPRTAAAGSRGPAPGLSSPCAPPAQGPARSCRNTGSSSAESRSAGGTAVAENPHGPWKDSRRPSPICVFSGGTERCVVYPTRVPAHKYTPVVCRRISIPQSCAGA